MVFKLKHGFHLFGWSKTEKQKLAKYKLMQTSSSCMSVTGMNHIFTPHHTQRFAPLLIIASPSLVNVPWIRAISFTGPSVWNNLPFPEQHGRTLFSSVQFRMVSMRLEKPICAPPCLSEVSPMLPLKWFQCSSD